MKVDLTGFKGDPNDCYNRALSGEPLFTLLARDPQAPQLVRDWAIRREAAFNPDPVWDENKIDSNKEAIGVKDTRGVWITPTNPDADMIAHARYLAARMEVWRYEHDGEWRQPESA